MTNAQQRIDTFAAALDALVEHTTEVYQETAAAVRRETNPVFLEEFLSWFDEEEEQEAAPATATDSSDSTHSPGPWRCDRFGEVVSDEGTTICHMKPPEGNWPETCRHDHENGNKSIVCSAPTMLAALRRVAKWAVSTGAMDDGEYDQSVRSDVLEAIARATP